MAGSNRPVWIVRTHPKRRALSSNLKLTSEVQPLKPAAYRNKTRANNEKLVKEEISLWKNREMRQNDTYKPLVLLDF